MVFISACATAEQEIVPEYNSDEFENTADLNGQTLVMGMVPDYFFEGENSVLTYTYDTDLGDLAAKRISDIENKYNCKLRFDYVERTGSLAFSSAAAGLYIFDFISEESFFLYNYLKTYAFQDLTKVENLDVFDETKWGSRYMRISTMYDGAIIGVLPAMHPMRLTNSIDEVLVVNEDLVNKLSATDPRDFYERGEWNWDTFEDCLLNYAFTDNANNFVYSLCAGMGQTARSLAICNGFDFITFNGNDDFEIGYFAPNAIEAYNWTFEVYNGPAGRNIDTEPSLQKFISGNSVMQYLSAYEIVSTTDSVAFRMDNFGIVPSPCGPSAKGPNDWKTSYSSADFTLAIPITAKDVEISALILDKIYDPFEGYETKDQVIEYLRRNYFLDVRDAEYFVEMSLGDKPFFHDNSRGFGIFQHIVDGVTKMVDTYKGPAIEAAKKNLVPAYKTLEMYEELFHD
jgi:hypothetical protein